MSSASSSWPLLGGTGHGASPQSRGLTSSPLPKKPLHGVFGKARRLAAAPHVLEQFSFAVVGLLCKDLPANPCRETGDRRILLAVKRLFHALHALTRMARDSSRPLRNDRKSRPFTGSPLEKYAVFHKKRPRRSGIIVQGPTIS
jgi:hypothetical protein